MCFFDSCCKRLPPDIDHSYDELNSINEQLALVRQNTNMKMRELEKKQKINKRNQKHSKEKECRIF